MLSTLLSSESCVSLSDILFGEPRVCSISEFVRQQHIIRKLSTIVSQVSSIMSLLLVLLLSLSFPSSFSLRDGYTLLVARAFSTACADRGVVALPLASVCVQKSGIANAVFVGVDVDVFDVDFAGAPAMGDLGTPGDRKSLLPRTPLGVGHDEGLSSPLASTVRLGFFLCLRCCCCC